MKNLILHKRSTKKFKRIIYVFPPQLENSPVDWDEIFPEIEVEYCPQFPTDENFWKIKSGTLVCIDDMFSKIANSDIVANAFRVYAKKRNFSLIAITQVFILTISINFWLIFSRITIQKQVLHLKYVVTQNTMSSYEIAVFLTRLE